MFKLFNKYFLVSIFTIVFFISCGIDNTDDNTVGNNFISAKVLQDVSSAKNLAYVKAFIDKDAKSAFAYKVVKIVYNTKDEKDNSVKASGVLIYPNVSLAFLKGYKKATGKNFSISTILENHGTIVKNSNAPSESITKLGSNSQASAVLMTAKAGFAVAMPDYLGYGESNDKPHPYILKKSSAKVSIDMLRASIRYMADNNILSNGQVYVSGYSEGGYVAMATAQELEKNYSDEFKLKGVAPMAGPYDLKAFGNKELNADRTMEVPYFLAYATSSYATRYKDITLDTILNTNINKETFNTLFNGSSSGLEIHAGLGLVTDTNASSFLGKGFKEYKSSKLFDTNFLSDYQSNENNPLRNRFEENSVYDWAPKTKMNLIHCKDDEIIPYTMSTKAYNTFKANLGDNMTNVTLTLLPSSVIKKKGLFVHSDCGATAYGVAVSWFHKIRSGEIK